MTAPGTGGDVSGHRDKPEFDAKGLSAFVARVLDQLSLSAWLPATLLTATVAVLLQFRARKSADLITAVGALTKDPLRLLVVLIPLLILTTMVTQAFSFEAIRTLEGYWRRRGLASVMRTLLIRRHARRKRRLARRRTHASEKAFLAARPSMLRRGLPHSIVDALEAQVLGTSRPQLSSEESAAVDSMNWRTYCAPWRLARIDHIIDQERGYPATSRVLPTKLGNLMRATEDSLQTAGKDIQGFALRYRDIAPLRVQVQHDQFRARLDMYCTLVFVSAFLALLTPTLLAGRSISSWIILAIVAIFCMLAAASYTAAIASAAGYCAALSIMDQLALSAISTGTTSSAAPSQRREPGTPV
jgi:hypothetical protein